MDEQTNKMRREVLCLVRQLDEYSTNLDQISKDNTYRNCGINASLLLTMSQLCYLEAQKVLVVLGEGYESAAHYRDEESKLCNSLVFSAKRP